MYAVVGCSECSALWVVEGRPETTECPRCDSRRQYAKLKKFVTTEDGDHARGVRSALLAARSDAGDDVTAASFAEMAAETDAVGPSHEEYLEGSGIDPDAVAEAGERATGGTDGSQSRDEVVRSAVRDLPDPTRESVLSRAEDRGVDRDAAGRILDRLRERGEAVVSDGVYRLV